MNSIHLKSLVETLIDDDAALGELGMAKKNQVESSESEIVRQIAERIARLRKERGITQIQLAETIGLKQSMVSRIEKGDYRLNGEAIIKIAKLYKVSTDEILGMNSQSIPTSSFSRRWLKRLSQIETLPKRDQDGLIQVVDRYLKASKVSC